MKKLLLLSLVFLLGTNSLSYAAFTGSTTVQKESNGNFKSADMRAAAEVFVNMSRQDYEQLTGKHLSIMERLAFKVQQKRMKRELIATQQTFGFNIGGFMLGFLLSAIGILLAYAFSQDTNVRRWAWIGGVIGLLLFILIVAL